MVLRVGNGTYSDDIVKGSSALYMVTEEVPAQAIHFIEQMSTELDCGLKYYILRCIVKSFFGLLKP
jgi:hypothetical protein